MPSLTAAAGSAYHQPARLFRPTSASVAAEVSVQNAVLAESAIKVPLPAVGMPGSCKLLPPAAVPGAEAAVDLSAGIGEQAQNGMLIGSESGSVNALTFNRSGTMLATAGTDGKVRLAGESGGIPTVAFSPSGAILATGGADGKVRPWDPATGRAIGVPVMADGAPLIEVRFSPDGTLLQAGVAADEADLFLGVIAARAASGQTGATWQRPMLARAEHRLPRQRALVTMLHHYLRHADTGLSVHTWPIDDP